MNFTTEKQECYAKDSPSSTLPPPPSLSILLKKRFWASIHTTSINYFMQQSPTPPLARSDLSLPVLPITQLVLSSEPPPPSQQNKPWPFTHPHDIVESPGVQDSTGEVKSVEGFSQGAVTMALRRKNSLGHVLADMSPDNTRKT